MISYLIPLETYNEQPLFFTTLTTQTNYMTAHLMNIYGNPRDEEWVLESCKATSKKLDMDKACVRFKNLDDLPVALMGEAIARTPVAEFIQMYEPVKGKP